MTYQSLAYQRQGLTFINELSRQTAFRDNLKTIKLLRGEHFANFLDNVKCTNDQNMMNRYIESGGTTRIPSCTSLFDYENSRFKVYKMQPLSRGNPKFQPLSTYYRIYLEKLLELHKKYFDKNKTLMKTFQLLAPHKWNSKIAFYKEKSSIYSLGQTLGVPDAQKLLIEWPRFKKEAMEHELYCASSDQLRKKPEAFYGALMNAKNFKVPPVVQKLLHFVMVIPTGTYKHNLVYLFFHISCQIIFYLMLTFSANSF